MDLTAQQIKDILGLEPHPEGGAYIETFRDNKAEPQVCKRGYSTAIYFLLSKGEISRWHRVKDASEVWHYYGGAALELSITSGKEPVTTQDTRNGPCQWATPTGGCSRRALADGEKPWRLDAGWLYSRSGLQLCSIRIG